MNTNFWYYLKVIQNHSSTFVYEPILMKICMNVNIMKTQLKKIVYFVYIQKQSYFFFTLRLSDLNTTFDSMNNFFPCSGVYFLFWKMYTTNNWKHFHIGSPLFVMSYWYRECFFFKNVSSSISHYKTPWFRDSEILAFFFHGISSTP